MTIRDFRLTVTRVPESSDGDLVSRTYKVRAASLREAEYRATVESVVSCMDNVVDWSATELEEENLRPLVERWDFPAIMGTSNGHKG